MDDLIKKLIYEAQTAKEVEKLLEDVGYNDESNWQPVGKSTGNFGTIGNQSPTAEQALAERVVNSIDAELMRACQEKGFSLHPPNSLKSMEDAALKLFGIKDGKLHSYINNLNAINQITRIHLSTTGYQGQYPTLNLVDQGEGQTPSRIEDTFLSLPSPTQDPYKVGIPFVQGRFNQGSTGSYIYSSYALIVTKRAKSLLPSQHNTTDENWGWSIVKRFPPPSNESQSVYKYLAPEGQILSFPSDKLNLLPTKIPKDFDKKKINQIHELAYSEPIASGTLVKLFDYEIKNLISNTIWNQLYRTLNRIFYEIPLPIRLHEMRKHLLRGKGDATNLNGQYFSLMQDRSNIVEKGFPNNINLRIPNVGEVTLNIWAMDFSKYDTGHQQSFKWFGDEAISFIINGQSHYRLSKRILERSDVALDFLKGTVFVSIDMTKVARDNLEMIFKTDRSGVREDKEIYKNLERAVLQSISNHKGLQELNDKRFEEQAKRSKTDTKTAEKVFSQLVSSNPILKNALLGNDIVSVGGFDWVKEKGKQYRGKPSPDFFRLKKQGDKR